MKLRSNEIKPGSVIEHRDPLGCGQNPSREARQGGAYAQVELKNLFNGTKLNERFRAAETSRGRCRAQDYQFSIPAATC